MARKADDLTEAELDELVGKIAQSGTRAYSTDFSLGMPILQEAGIALRRVNGTWYAMAEGDGGTTEQVSWGRLTILGGKKYGPYSYQTHKRIKRFSGPTMLIAGLRCFVAANLKDEIDVYETSR